jgi:hypothetical protein
LLHADLGFHHRSFGTVKFGKCAIALHTETNLGVLVSKTDSKQRDQETKMLKKTMKTQTEKTMKKNAKANWKALAAFLVVMVPLV